MVTFDEVLPAVVRTCETWAGFVAVKTATVIRDLEGRIRLAIALTPGGAAFDRGELSRLLRNALESWLAEEVLVADDASAKNKLLAALVGDPQSVQARSWDDATYEPSAGAPKATVAAGRWWLIERRLSKLDWLQPSLSEPPWPLAEGQAKVITFYSFKGGVGRSTLAAAVAWQLARQRKHVVVVDLDLEAPGIGALLGAGSERGVIDFLVDYVAADRRDVDTLVQVATALGNEASYVEVVPAGDLNAEYFEKLARLDFIGAGLTGSTQSPVAEGLRLLLTKLRYRTPRPDFILLDARAGLHDLAGLSLHGLAHVDVLVARDSEQSYRGLDLVVRALGHARPPDKLSCIVVHSMAPSDKKSEEFTRVTGEFRRRSFDAFSEHVYARLADDDPEDNDETAGHYPWTVGFTDRLVRFTELASIEDVVLGPDYQRIVERIVELTKVPPGDLSEDAR